MITSLSISNFKSIQNLSSITFGQSSNFIIGKNGAGKSNLLSVIELTKRLCNGQSFEQALLNIAPFGIEIFSKNSSTSSSTIKLNLRDKLSNRYELIYSYSYTNNEFIITDEKLTLIDKNLRRENIYIRKIDSFQAKDNQTKEIVDIPLAVKSDELALASFNNEVAANVVSLITNFQILWLEKSGTNYAFRVHRKDALNTSNLDGLVVYLANQEPELFEKANAVIKQLIPEFTAPDITSIGAPLKSKQDSSSDKSLDRYIVFWNENAQTTDQGIQYTLSGLSDGNFRIIQLIYAIFVANNSSCLIGEELENGQHYGRLKTMIEILKHLSIKLNVQLIFTTHSNEILNYISPDDVIYASKDKDGNSSYSRLSDAVSLSMIKSELGHEPTAKELIDLGMV